MPIRRISTELVDEIVSSYKKLSSLNLSNNGSSSLRPKPRGVHSGALVAEIVVIENLDRLNCLQKLNLSNNRVELLNNLSHLRKLKFLGLANNRM